MTNPIFKTTIEINENNTNRYYKCTKCSYSTNHTSHFKRHIISCQPEKYSFYFLKNEHCGKNISSFTINKNLKNIKKEGINSIRNESAKNFPLVIKDEIYEGLNKLKQILDNNNHLSFCDFPLSNNFIIHSNKIIGEGAFSTCHLGEDNLSGIKVAILKIDLENDDEYLMEEYVLQKLHGLGNYPPLYECVVDKDYAYLIEGFMGFNLKTLFKLCDHSFGLLTIINIGIDLIKNMKIFHGMGFIHRDLKPDNLVFGPL